jgi:hypothetical protein
MSDLRIRGVQCLAEQPYSAVEMIIPAYLQISIDILYEVLCRFCAGGGWWRLVEVASNPSYTNTASVYLQVRHSVALGPVTSVSSSSSVCLTLDLA